MSEYVTIWTLYCSTGCSCCSDENFECGPFLTKEAAEAKAKEFKELKRLCSQYSSTGNYHVSKWDDAEPISGGRFILGDTVWGPEYEEKHP